MTVETYGVSMVVTRAGAPPRIELNLLAERADLRWLAAGLWLRWCWRIAAAPQMQPYIERVLLWSEEPVATLCRQSDLVARAAWPRGWRTLGAPQCGG